MFNSKRGHMQMWYAGSRKAVGCCAVFAVAALGMLLPETISAARAGASPQEPAQRTKPAPAANPAASQNGPQSSASRPGWDMIGQNSDESAQAASGKISQSEGSFDSATGVTCESEVQCPNLQCPKSPSCSGQPSNAFSLQLNTQMLVGIAQCTGRGGCFGVEQFVFSNSQCGKGGLFYPNLNSKACVYIQYWLDYYGNDCPKPFLLP